MITKPKKALCLLSLSLVVAIVLTNVFCLTSVEASGPGREPNRASEKRAVKVSPLLEPGKRAPQERVPVVVELIGRPSGQLNAFLNRNDVHRGRKMETLNAFSMTLPFNMVAKLASFPEVLHVSENEVMRATSHVSAATGADAGRQQASSAGYGSIDGSGIGIAILDSGIDLNHSQFTATGSASRVLASVDFTGENRIDDPYGHGTYVAAAAAGGAGAGAAYTGIAPKASLLNVRVLNSNGQGTVESVLAGLEWVAANAPIQHPRRQSKPGKAGG